MVRSTCKNTLSKNQQVQESLSKFFGRKTSTATSTLKESDSLLLPDMTFCPGFRRAFAEEMGAKVALESNTFFEFFPEKNGRFRFMFFNFPSIKQTSVFFLQRLPKPSSCLGGTT